MAPWRMTAAQQAEWGRAVLEEDFGAGDDDDMMSDDSALGDVTDDVFAGIIILQFYFHYKL